MARFEQRGSSIRVTVRLPGGARKTGTFDTQGEAERWAAEMERKKSVGALTGSAGHSVTVRDLIDAFEEVASKTDSGRWNTLRLMKWSADPLAKQRLLAVTTHEINQWVDRRLKTVSGATVNRELNLMGSMFTYAVKVRRWISVNPCHGCYRPPEGSPRDHRLLTPDQLKAIAQATGYNDDPDLRLLTSRVGACFLLSLETGMRSGEILRLRPTDYDKAAMTVFVSATEKGGRKGARSGRVAASRHVPLTKRATEILDQLMRHRPDPKYIVGLSDSQRDALWRKARDRSGVEGLNFHDAKHEAATRMAKFLDVLALSHALGTKDLKLLRDTYYSRDAERSAKLLPASLTP